MRETTVTAAKRVVSFLEEKLVQLETRGGGSRKVASHLGGLICLPFNRFSRNSLRCRRERRPCEHQTSVNTLSAASQHTAEGMSPYRIHGLLCLQGLGVFDGLHLLLVFPQHPDQQELCCHILTNWNATLF